MPAKPSIPAVSPLAGYLAHKAEIDEAIRQVLHGGQYILGQATKAFEEEFAGYLGVRYGLGVGSGTDALHLALRACDIGPEDEVITSAHTAVATIAAIELSGARPVLVDIDPQTFTLDPDQIGSVVTSRTKALLPVHLYGHPAEMRAILAIGHRYGLRVIEDCAQAHGASYNGRKLGTWGDIAAFSFYPTKNLGAVGDAGMVVTDDADLAMRVRLLREYGWRARHVSEIAGMNSRLDELQATVLRVKLRYLDAGNARRRELAAIYCQLLARENLTLPVSREGVEHIYHQYVIRSSRRDELRTYLQAQGIGSLVHYPVSIHLQPAYQGRLRLGRSLRWCESVAGEVLSLPMFPELSTQQVQRVASAINAWARESVAT